MDENKLYSLLRSVKPGNDELGTQEQFELLVYKTNMMGINSFLADNEAVMLYPEDLMIVEVKDFSACITKRFSTQSGGGVELQLKIEDGGDSGYKECPHCGGVI